MCLRLGFARSLSVFVSFHSLCGVNSPSETTNRLQECRGVGSCVANRSQLEVGSSCVFSLYLVGGESYRQIRYFCVFPFLLCVLIQSWFGTEPAEKTKSTIVNHATSLRFRPSESARCVGHGPSRSSSAPGARSRARPRRRLLALARAISSPGT